MAIESFANLALEDFFFDGTLPRRCKWAQVSKKARNKLEILNAVSEVQQLRVPPGNRLEKLQGDLAGLWSIRINKQWRIVFHWEEDDEGPSEVEIMDYH